ncbi:GNAT family N-acetyltransferase [Roseobacter sp. HKCCA0434]|uniref:GNAT family N-acetyltransferase n=1 Tax=Roseobacter sp. HKCCA0434 TaxID=3079297 RepID=UPI0029058057|nr:GNAT family N-acetyltransferase [Roseobacter sp. HKCCA0434]
MRPWHVRKAGAETSDAELLALLRAAFAYMDGRIDPPSSLVRMDRAEIAAKRAEEDVLVVREGGRLVACAFLATHPDHHYLGKLAVHPDRQGTGLGRALVEAAIARATRPEIRLQTRVELVENHAAFARLGFVETGRTTHPGYDRPTSVSMALRL